MDTDSPSASIFHYPQCRLADQWADLYYYFGDHADTPVFEVPYELTCLRDPSIVKRGVLGPDGRHRVEGLIPGPFNVVFWPEDDVQTRLEVKELYKELEDTLNSIVLQVQSESVYQDQVLDEMPWYEQGLVYTGAFMTGVMDGAEAFATGMAEAGKMLSAMGIEAYDIWQCIQTGNYSELERKAEAAYASGKAFLSASKEAFQSLILILSDRHCRNLLKAFPERYWNAHSKVERVRKLAALGTDITIGIIVAAIGAAVGAGIVGAVGAIAARLARPIQKVIEVLQKLAASFRKLKLRSKRSGYTKNENKYRWNNPPERQRDLDHEASSEKPGTNRNGDSTPKNDETPTRKEPISMVTGEELLELVDFVLPGPIPLPWKRVYRTSNHDDSGMGHGWLHPGCERLEVTPTQTKYFDAEGRIIEFPTPAIGKYTTNDVEDLTLFREWESIFFLKQKGQPTQIFLGRHTERKPEVSAPLEIIPISKLQDTSGNEIQFVQSGGLLEKIETNWGRNLTVLRDEAGLISQIQLLGKNGNNHTLAHYHYSSERDLACAQDPAGYAETYQYHNHVISQRNLKGGSTIHFEWDQHTTQARCTRQWIDDGLMDTQFQWLPEEQKVSVTNSFGHTETLTFDSGKLLEQIDQEGHTTQFEYDDIGRLTSKTDPQGYRFECRYDERSNLSASLDPSGGGFSQIHDEADNLVSYSDALGNSWNWEFNDQQIPDASTGGAANRETMASRLTTQTTGISSFFNRHRPLLASFRDNLTYGRLAPQATVAQERHTRRPASRYSRNSPLLARPGSR